MGGLRKLVPFTYSVMMTGSLAFVKLPFLTGFYSKDVVLEVAYGKRTVWGHFASLLGSLAAFYSIKLDYLTFLAEPNGYKPIIIHAHDSPIKMGLPLAILTIPSIFIGYFTKDMTIGMGSDFWGNSIYVLPKNMNMIDAEFIPHIWKVFPVCFSILGATLSFFLYTFGTNFLYKIKMSFFGRKLYNFLNKKWLFDKVYAEFIIQSFLSFSYHISYKIVDRGIIEILGPMGLSNLVSKKSHSLHKLQTGFLYHYAFLMLIGTTLLLGVLQLGDTIFNFLDYRLLFIFLITMFF